MTIGFTGSTYLEGDGTLNSLTEISLRCQLMSSRSVLFDSMGKLKRTIVVVGAGGKMGCRCCTSGRCCTLGRCRDFGGAGCCDRSCGGCYRSHHETRIALDDARRVDLASGDL